MKKKAIMVGVLIMLFLTGCGGKEIGLEAGHDSSAAGQEAGAAEAGLGAGTESDVGNAVGSETASEPEPGAEPDAGSATESAAEPEPEPGVEQDTGNTAESGTVPESKPGAEPETAPEPEAVPDVDIPAAPPDQASEQNGHIIAIDAGHQAKGNRDKEPLGPGSTEMKAKVSSGTRGVSTKVYEYELNLVISQALQEELIARGYQVVMIRESHDVDISNKERAETANESGAEIFLRIHANGSENSEVKGTLTICNTSSSPYNVEIHDSSLVLAQTILDHMVAEMGSNNRGVWQTDTMSGINWCTIPTTIIEMGYMSNAEEDELMQTEEYQEKIVRGIADGVDAYFNP